MQTLWWKSIEVCDNEIFDERLNFENHENFETKIMWGYVWSHGDQGTTSFPYQGHIICLGETCFLLKKIENRIVGKLRTHKGKVH